MAISVIATVSGSSTGPAGGGADFTTSSINTTGANLIVVSVTYYTGGGVPTLTDSKSNTWTSLTSRSSTNQVNHLFYCAAPTVGSGHTFSITDGGGSNYTNLQAIAVSGAAASPFDQEGGATSNSNVTTIQPGSLTPSQSGCLLVTGLNCATATVAPTIGSGFTSWGTQVQTANVQIGGGAAYLVQGAAAAINPTWTWTTGSETACSMAVFKPSGGGNATGYTLTAGVSSGPTNWPVTITASLTGGSTLSSTLTITLADDHASTISGTIVILNGQTSGTATITPTASGVHAITATHTGGGFAGGDGSTSFTAVTAIAVTDSNLYFSPGNWYSNGGGALSSTNIHASSTYALCNTPGGYMKTVINSGGTGSIAVAFDVTILTGITSGNTPKIAYSIDGAAWSATQLTAGTGTQTITLGSSLAAGNHSVEMYFMAVDLSGTNSMGDRWLTPTTGFSGVKVVGIEIDGGSSLATPTPLSKKALWLGDSSLEGAQNLSTSLGVSGQDAGQTYGYIARLGLNAEIGIVGFSSQGYSQAGYGNTPALYNATLGNSAWNFYYSGASRTAQSFDYIICSHGINGGAVAATVQAFIGQVRGVYASAKILILVPWNGTSRSAITTGVTDYQTANPSDTDVFLIDPQTIPTGSNYYSGNANHPSLAGDALAASAFVGSMRNSLAGGGGGGGGSSIIRISNNLTGGI